MADEESKETSWGKNMEDNCWGKREKVTNITKREGVGCNIDKEEYKDIKAKDS